MIVGSPDPVEAPPAADTAAGVRSGGEPEVVLVGGNSNEVVRIGSTVRRRIPENGVAVHALLSHLDQVGFVATPRFLGIDPSGREILGYIDGEPGLHPHSADVRSDAALVAIVRLVRDYHDATVAFVERARDLRWPGAVATGFDLPVEVVCHGDLAPYNMIFRGATPVGLIDFDNAAPGSRIEDLAHLAHRLAPLTAERNYSDAGWDPDVDRVGRLRRIVQLYGTVDVSNLIDLVLVRLQGFCDWIRQRAAAGDPAVAVQLRDNHLGIYETDLVWITANRPMLERALGV